MTACDKCYHEIIGAGFTLRSGPDEEPCLQEFCWECGFGVLGPLLERGKQVRHELGLRFPASNQYARSTAN